MLVLSFLRLVRIKLPWLNWLDELRFKCLNCVWGPTGRHGRIKMPHLPPLNLFFRLHENKFAVNFLFISFLFMQKKIQKHLLILELKHIITIFRKSNKNAIFSHRNNFTFFNVFFLHIFKTLSPLKLGVDCWKMNL